MLNQIVALGALLTVTMATTYTDNPPVNTQQPIISIFHPYPFMPEYKYASALGADDDFNVAATVMLDCGDTCHFWADNAIVTAGVSTFRGKLVPNGDKTTDWDCALTQGGGGDCTIQEYPSDRYLGATITDLPPAVTTRVTRTLFEQCTITDGAMTPMLSATSVRPNPGFNTSPPPIYSNGAEHTTKDQHTTPPPMTTAKTTTSSQTATTTNPVATKTETGAADKLSLSLSSITCGLLAVAMVVL